MAKRRQSLGGWVIIGLAVLGISQFAKGPGKPVPSSISTPMQTQLSSPATVAVPAQEAREVRYVTATTLNVRRDPSTSADVVSSLAQGSSISVLERRNGWLLVSISSNQNGWVSEQYTATSKPQPRYTPPSPISQPTQSASGLSCSPRRTCGQIGSCRAAQWYRQNCSWGGRLDRDNDGLACETLC